MAIDDDNSCSKRFRSFNSFICSSDSREDVLSLSALPDVAVEVDEDGSCPCSCSMRACFAASIFLRSSACLLRNFPIHNVVVVVVVVDDDDVNGTGEILLAIYVFVGGRKIWNASTEHEEEDEEDV